MSDDGDPAAERTTESDDPTASDDVAASDDPSAGAESSTTDETAEPADASVFGGSAGSEESSTGESGTSSESTATDASTASDDSTTPGADVTDLHVDASVVDRAAEYDEDLASDVDALFETATGLSDRVAELEAERDQLVDELADREDDVEDLTSRLKRKQADFENYKKRRERKESEIRERATEDLVERLLDVRDNLRRAVEEEGDDVEGLREGVKMTLGEFDRVLDAENVAAIEPASGEEVDPQRHEVMMRVESDEPGGTIADVYEPGYEMAEKVLRPAKVAVSED